MPVNRRSAGLSAIIAAGVALAGCSATEIIHDLGSTSTSDLSPPLNHHRLVADNVKAVFPNRENLGELEISGLRQVDHLKGPVWLTCLKLDAQGTPQLFAIFIQGNKIVDARAGIVIDQCHKQTYTPLER